MTSALPSSKITFQSIMSLVMVAVTAGATALNDGITLEPGPAAGAVGAVVALLVALGYYKPEKRPSPSAVETLHAEGFIDPEKVIILRQRGLLKPAS